MMVTTLLARIRLVFLALVLALGMSVSATAQKLGPDGAPNPTASLTSERDLLKQVPRVEGRIDIPDTKAAVLIQPAGRTWDYFHEVLLHWGGAIVILGMIVVLGAAYLILGRLRITEGRSGQKIVRFKAFERFSHWLTALSFVVLGLTGLNITFGKILLLPVIGPDAFSSVSELAKYAHNFTSFSFVAGLVLIIAIFFKDNLPERVVVSVSGFVLLFPFYGTSISDMQIAQAAHAIVAVLFVALILGHIYIGTLGMEGAFEAMGTGEVDLNWAKEHHDVWLARTLAGNDPQGSPSATPAE
jgi:formate dehydrogenase subunit gamma